VNVSAGCFQADSCLIPEQYIHGLLHQLQALQKKNLNSQ